MDESWVRGQEDNDSFTEYEVKGVNEYDTLNSSLGGRLASQIRCLSFKQQVMTLRKLSSMDILPPMRGLIITTDTKAYQCWWLFMVIMSLYSSMFTPLEFGFFRGLSRPLWIVDLCVQIVFLADIGVKFCTAYKDRHTYRLNVDHCSIAKRYVKKDFLIELLGCCPWDFIYKWSGRKEEVRYLVWIRLYRVRKVDSFFVRLEKDIRINYFAARIVKLLAVEFYCTHTAACIFYYLATTVRASRESYTWIGSLVLGSFSYEDFRQIDLGKRYVTSLYWAVLTMATVGYGDIHAVNVREMVFVMLFVSFDMILGAYLLGNMTALIVKGSSTEKFRDKMGSVIKYMNKYQLPKNIRKQMKNHIRLQFETGTLADEHALDSLPVSIRSAVAHSLFGGIVNRVPIFKGCSPEFLNEVVSKVVQEYFLPGEIVIHQGGASDQFYIVCEGVLEELLVHEDGNVEVIERLEEQSIFGEVGVLCNIPQPFSVRVGEKCRLLRLDKQSFTDIVEVYFNDGRLLLNNLLESKDVDARAGQVAADVTFMVTKQAAELALMVNNASYQGDLAQLKHLVKQGAIVARADYDGRTPLHLAASKGFESVVLYLLGEGAEINAIDNFGISPLFESVKGGHDRCISVLLDQGAELHLRDAGGYLCKITEESNNELLRRLLVAGVDVNASDYDKRTALHIAAAEGSLGLAKLLIDAGADVSSQDRWGRTALDEATLHERGPLIAILKDVAHKRKHDPPSGAKPAPRSTRSPFSREGSAEPEPRLDESENEMVRRRSASIDYASSTPSSHLGTPRRGLVDIFDRPCSSEKRRDGQLNFARGLTSCGFEMSADNYRRMPLRQGSRPPVLDHYSPTAQRHRRRVTIFPFHPWIPPKERTTGITEWVPPTIEEILDLASQHLGKVGVKVLNQDGGQLLRTDLIMDAEKVYVVDDSERD